MQITSNNKVTVRLVHLDYMLNGMGMATLMHEFRAEQCHKFLHWLQKEIHALKESLPEHQEVGVISVPADVCEMAIYMLSKLAYKILCDNKGMVIPTMLLHEVQCLEKFQEEAIKSRPRRVTDGIWSNYQDESHWIEAVHAGAKEYFTEMLNEIKKSEDIYKTSAEYAPKLEIITNNFHAARMRTTESVVKLDLTELTQCFNQPTIRFDEPLSFSDGDREGGFEHRDWAVIVMAKLSIEMAESFRVFMMRHYRRVGDEDMFELYKIQESEGFAYMYKFLRERYVEPRLKPTEAS